MSETNAPKTNINANLELVPQLSQVVIITGVIVAALSLFASFYFLWHEKNGYWVPLCASMVLFLMSATGWWRSQRAIDLNNAVATTIQSSNGLSIVTDSRSFESEQATKNIGDIISTIAYRQPLPAADGVIDDKGGVIPESEDTARQIISGINDKLQNEVNLVQEVGFDDQLRAQSVSNELPLDKEITKHSGEAKI